MNVEIGLVLNGAIVLGGLAAGWGLMRSRVQFANQEMGEIKRQIERLWDYKDDHEKEDSERHFIMSREISLLQGHMEARAKENTEILRQLDMINSNIVNMREEIAVFRADRRKMERP